MKPTDVFASSKELKRVIYERIRSNNISFYKLCVENNVTPNALLNWFRLKQGSVDHVSLTHANLLDIMEALRIDYRLVIVLKDEKDIDVERYVDHRRRALRRAYEKRMDDEFAGFVKKQELLDKIENGDELTGSV